jgi:lysozyme family protein
LSGFQQALEHVFGAEGGLANDPADRGGRTNLGITTETWERWRDRLGKPNTAVDACTREDATQIYYADYWVAQKCDALVWPVSLCHFDAAVQHHPPYPAVLLQRALGVKEDGIIGPGTLAAAAAAKPGPLIRAMMRGRLEYYRKIATAEPSQRVFLPGWLQRVLDLWARCIRDYPEAA